MQRDQVTLARHRSSPLWVRIQLDVPDEDVRFYLRAQRPHRRRALRLVDQLGSATG